MLSKLKRITVSPREWMATKDGKPARYQVEKVTDNVDFAPGEMIPTQVVMDLCKASDWKVTIINK